MLPSYFDYIFVHLKQEVRLRPELSQKFWSTLGPKPSPTRKARPDTTLMHHAKTKLRKYQLVIYYLKFLKAVTTNFRFSVFLYNLGFFHFLHPLVASKRGKMFIYGVILGKMMSFVCVQMTSTAVSAILDLFVFIVFSEKYNAAYHMQK